MVKRFTDAGLSFNSLQRNQVEMLVKVDSYESKTKSKVADHVSVLVKAGQSVSNLPPEVKESLGTLKLWKSFDLNPNEPRVGLDVKAAIADLDSQGYHISRVVVTTTVQDVPNPGRK